MAEAVCVENVRSRYQPEEEEELPVKGFLFKNKLLVGVYTINAFIPVKCVLPDLSEDILKGGLKPKMFLRLYRMGEEEIYEVVLVSGYKSWHIASFSASPNGTKHILPSGLSRPR